MVLALPRFGFGQASNINHHYLPRSEKQGCSFVIRERLFFCYPRRAALLSWWSGHGFSGAAGFIFLAVLLYYLFPRSKAKDPPAKDPLFDTTINGITYGGKVLIIVDYDLFMKGFHP